MASAREVSTADLPTELKKSEPSDQALFAKHQIKKNRKASKKHYSSFLQAAINKETFRCIEILNTVCFCFFVLFVFVLLVLLCRQTVPVPSVQGLAEWVVLGLLLRI